MACACSHFQICQCAIFQPTHGEYIVRYLQRKADKTPAFGIRLSRWHAPFVEFKNTEPGRHGHRCDIMHTSKFPSAAELALLLPCCMACDMDEKKKKVTSVGQTPNVLWKDSRILRLTPHPLRGRKRDLVCAVNGRLAASSHDYDESSGLSSSILI